MAVKNGKLLIVVMVFSLLTVSGGSLYASPFFFTSPQKTATATQFRSDADNFIDVRRYAGIEFDNFFGVVSFQNADLSQVGQSNMMQLGIAAQFGSLYTALYYGGNTLALPEQAYREDKDGTRIYANFPRLILPSGVLPRNEAALLLGVADMGFRLSFVSTYNPNKLKDFYFGTAEPYVVIKNYQGEHGSLNPEIAWGMAKELVPGRGIKPHLYIDLDFFRDYEKYDTGTGDRINKSENDFTLGITAAAGGFSLINENGFDFGVDLWYTLNLKTFGNEYSQKQYDSAAATPGMVIIPGKVVSFTGKKTGTGGNVDAGDPALGLYDYYDVSCNNHLITPYLYTSLSGDSLELSAELGLEFGITSSNNTGLITNDSAPVKHGTDTKTTAFSFIPSLDLGMQWAIVPDKFYLNAGGHIQFLAVNMETSVIDTYDRDSKVGDTTKSIKNTFEGASTALSVGVTFNVTPNLGLQAMSGVGIGTNNNISVFGTGNTAGNTNGLAVFSQIMVTVKF
jgi:hypothetical protein